jgi:ABC-2 type transport system ATP-binding protein
VNPLVEIDGLEKTFVKGGKPALSGLSAKIQTGMVTGLVGPDGAGKTTLARLMAGLLAPTTGSIRIEGLDPIRNAADLRGKIGYMPQRFGLYEDLTVQENLNLYAELRGVRGPERDERFRQLLAFTDLARFTGRLAGKLSGGMKQKLGLACTLLGRPRLLLLDEPGVGVDPISRRELWRMIRDLVSEGIAVVWTTAYLDEAELCEEVLLLNEGRMLYNGPPRDLTGRMAGRCFQIRSAPGSRRRLLERVLRDPGVLDGAIQGRNVRVITREKGPTPDPAAFDSGSGAECAPVAPRFEDAFMDLLGGGPGGDSVLAAHVRSIPQDGATVIEAVELTKKFGDFAAADRVNFTVTRGEIFGLLGPNGAGKSTTFKLMCGLLTPTAGTARVMGLDLQKSASDARQRLGYMAQKFSLYGSLSVRQNLNFFSGIYGLNGGRQRRAVDDMVGIFGLDTYLNTTPDTLPLGYKQRLALACAVMHEPDILFLDEPTSGVDPVTRREFWTHINGLVEKGVTVLVTTHFMDEAEYCDRVGLVFRGEMIACGTPDELKQKVVSPDRADPTMEDAFIHLIQSHAA